MTPPRRIGAVTIPRPWESSEQLARLQCLDLHAMTPAQLKRERRRLESALGVATDAQLSQSMFVLWGVAPMDVETYLEGRLAIVRQLLASPDGP